MMTTRKRSSFIFGLKPSKNTQDSENTSEDEKTIKMCLNSVYKSSPG